jgi:hypothetical protein
VSHAVPVFQGFAIPNSIRRIDVAGRDVTEHFQQLLRKSGRIFHTSAEKETVKNIKEATGYVALDPAKEEKEWSGSARSDNKSAEYTLPDGQKLKVSWICCATTGNKLTIIRSAQSDFEHRKSCSIPKSSAWNTPVFTRSWLRRYIGQTWTFGNRSMATLCCLVVPH